MDDKYSELQSYFDNRYVLKDTCKSTHDSLNSNVTDIKLAQERISTKLEFSSKIEIAIHLKSDYAISNKFVPYIPSNAELYDMIKALQQ